MSSTIETFDPRPSSMNTYSRAKNKNTGVLNLSQPVRKGTAKPSGHTSPSKATKNKEVSPVKSDKKAK